MSTKTEHTGAKKGKGYWGRKTEAKSVSKQKRRSEDKKSAEEGKFENFLQSLKGKGQDFLIESIHEGFQACLEVGGVFVSSAGNAMGRGYSPYLKQRTSKSNIHEYKTNLPFPFKGEHDIEVKIDFEWEPAEKQTGTYPGADEKANPISIVVLDTEYNRSVDNPKALDSYYGKNIVSLLSEEQLVDLEGKILTDDDVYIPDRDFVSNA